jgi:hypothetical protein
VSLENLQSVLAEGLAVALGADELLLDLKGLSMG